MRRRARLQAWRCHAGHVTLQADNTCATCGSTLRALWIRPEATLELVTTVRINPSGQPFRIGIAVTRAGHARTLCLVEGDVRGLGHDAVLLEHRGDTIVARPVRLQEPPREVSVNNRA
jgi:uncharacterized OB-fold protein